MRADRPATLRVQIELPSQRNDRRTAARRTGASDVPCHSRSPSRDTPARARAGAFTTPHGAVETPAFMAVGTLATVKALDPTTCARWARR